jgi:hypothetical protein
VRGDFNYVCVRVKDMFFDEFDDGGVFGLVGDGVPAVVVGILAVGVYVNGEGGF